MGQGSGEGYLETEAWWLELLEVASSIQPPRAPLLPQPLSTCDPPELPSALSLHLAFEVLSPDGLISSKMVTI